LCFDNVINVKRNIEIQEILIRQLFILSDSSQKRIAVYQQTQSQFYNSMTSLFDALNIFYFVVEIVQDEDSNAVDAIFQEVNHSFERLLGKTREEIIGKSRTEVLGVTPSEVINKLHKTAKTGEGAHFIVYGTNLKKYYDMYCWRISDNQVTGIGTDITERKFLEEQLNDHTVDLQKLVEERTNQLRETERLAAIGQTAGMVGHDIRNPLQAIISDLYLIKSELESAPQLNSKESVIESIESIERNIAYINKIVADLQDYARKLKPEYSEIDISELMSNVVKELGVPREVDVVISSNTFKKIKTDPTFIRRILTNLVNNAVQAMPNGGNLELSTLAKEGKMYISVGDSGAGIPMEMRSKLFTPMLTTKAKGQGLGLAVVKRLVEALNGKVSFESQDGKGTKFIIELPIIQ
jgi:PAS domain S-box-containing protein